MLTCGFADGQQDFFASQSTVLPPPASTLQGVPNGLPNPSSIITTPPAQLTQPPGTFQPSNSVPGFNTTPQVAPPPNITLPDFNAYQAPNQPFPTFPQQAPVQNYGAPAYGAQPSTYKSSGTSWIPSDWESFKSDTIPRLFEHSRVRYTYLPGNNGNEVGINDLELATTLNWAGFLHGKTPLRISPGWIFHYWSGPDTGIYPDFDLPPRAYSGYLAFDHVTDPSVSSGFESNLTIGYYSDFNSSSSSDAIRLTGKLLGWTRLNCYTVGKLGVEYLDRVNVKLLPAFGIYMTPNADMKLDLYFPKSKLAHRIPNVNNFEAWAYIGGEYGAGSWAIQRIDITNDQADINDVRAFTGVEWMGPRRVTSFFELGYVFNRRLVYRSDSLNTLDLQDTIMLRMGFAF